MEKGLLGALLLQSILAMALGASAASADGLTALSGHVPHRAIALSQDLGLKPSQDVMRLAVTLQPRNSNQLDALLKALYTPGDSQFHHFVTPAQFAQNFAPSQDDVDQVASYLSAQGLEVIGVHSNHLVIDLQGPVSSVESALQVSMHQFIAPDGRIAHAPTSEPLLPDGLAAKIAGISGLSNFAERKPHLQRTSQFLSPLTVSSNATINTYMTPTKIKSAYGLSSLTQTGSGETLALFELDGYTASDIQQYATNFSLTQPTLQNILVDSATGTPGSGADEVTLDIELAMAIAPGLSKIMVYEGPNTSAGVIDTYNKIATDDLANEVSTSWGSAENENTMSDLNSENTIFKQMAAQGQSIFAAAGDSAAYDDSINGVNTLEVDDPASQPYMTGVGGTLLTVDGSGAWSSETSWHATAASGTFGQSGYSSSEGGGGGISKIWTIPSWQGGVASAANRGSSSMRMVPDVSLEADPTFGYPIYYTDPTNGAGWYLVGGTSCAAPLWAAFTALINQARISNSLARIGFVNPSIYNVAQSGLYSSDFHDIADGSTNLFYPATSGYDMTTGWGSFNGQGLFDNLTAAPGSPSQLAVQEVQ